MTMLLKEGTGPSSNGVPPFCEVSSFRSSRQVASWLVDKDQVGLDRQPDAIFDPWLLDGFGVLPFLVRWVLLKGLPNLWVKPKNLWHRTRIWLVFFLATGVQQVQKAFDPLVIDKTFVGKVVGVHGILLAMKIPYIVFLL